jgi:hypothetical protein
MGDPTGEADRGTLSIEPRSLIKIRILSVRTIGLVLLAVSLISAEAILASAASARRHAFSGGERRSAEPSRIELPTVPQYVIELPPDPPLPEMALPNNMPQSPSSVTRTFWDKFWGAFPIILEIVAFPLVTVELLMVLLGREQMEEAHEHILDWIRRDHWILYSFLPLIILMFAMGMVAPLWLPYAGTFGGANYSLRDFAIMVGRVVGISLLALVCVIMIVVLGYYAVRLLKFKHLNGLLVVIGSVLFVIAKVLAIVEGW